MLGAIVGNIIGSVHEGIGTKTKDFPLLVPRSTFTDDSVLTVAVAEWILTGESLIDLLHSYFHAYLGRGYGGMFRDWTILRRRQPYNSYGNGAAVRVSPAGFAEAYYGGVPQDLLRPAMARLDAPLAGVACRFREKFDVAGCTNA